MYISFCKRTLDFTLSVLLLAILMPLLLALSFIGFLFMRGNPFFVQKRPGKKDKSGAEKVFKLIKFRTMSNKRDSDGNFLPDEKRLSKYGTFLRKSSLDELPELFNILMGSMSFVGPRPLLIKDLVFMTPDIRKRHDVLPGLTGLAQINGRNTISWENKFLYDLEYVERINFLSDFNIFCKTFSKVLKHKDICREGTASDIDYGDYLLETNKISKHEYDSKILLTKTILERNK